MSRTISHFVGIDHGATGAIVALNLDGSYHGHASFAGGDWLAVRGRVIDLFESIPHPYIMEERVSGRAEDAKHAPQILQFGINAGLGKGAIVFGLGRTIDEDVTPSVWMKALGCQTGGDKAVTIRAARTHIKGFPTLPKTQGSGVADAALVALYALRLHNARKARS